MYAMRKYVVLAGWMLVGALLLSGVASAYTYKYEGPKFKDTQIRMVLPGGWAEVEILAERAGEFEKATGIKLIPMRLAWSDVDPKQYMAAVMHSGEFDIICENIWSVQLYKPFAYPMDEFVKRDFGSVERWKNRFYTHIEFSVGADGKIYSWPFHFPTPFGVYRKELFEDSKEKTAFAAKYGYELKPPSNRKELLDVARFFTRDTDGDGKIDLWGLITEGDVWAWGQNLIDLFLRNGIDFFDENFNIPLEKGPQRDLAIEIARFWQDLVYKYKVMPPDQAGIDFVMQVEIYKQGGAAMSWGHWQDNFNVMKRKEIVDRIGETGALVLYPKDRNTGGWLGWSSWMISGDCEHPEAAWELIKWACAKELQMEVCKGYGYPRPVLAWNEEAYQKGWLPKEIVETLPVVRPPLPILIPETTSMLEKMYSIAHAQLANVVTPEECVDQMVEVVKKTLDKGGYRK